MKYVTIQEIAESTELACSSRDHSFSSLVRQSILVINYGDSVDTVQTL